MFASASLGSRDILHVSPHTTTLGSSPADLVLLQKRHLLMPTGNALHIQCSALPNTTSCSALSTLDTSQFGVNATLFKGNILDFKFIHLLLLFNPPRRSPTTPTEIRVTNHIQKAPGLIRYTVAHINHSKNKVCHPQVHRGSIATCTPAYCRPCTAIMNQQPVIPPFVYPPGYRQVPHIGVLVVTNAQQRRLNIDVRPSDL